ncbi:MAG: triose-phosphate isomerase [Chitinophagales bacterium]
MRKKIAAGNWKMNLGYSDAKKLAEAVARFDSNADREIVLFPPFVYLELVKQVSSGTSVQVGAQNICDRENGAFTGEISAPMLRSMEIPYVLIGHSERRMYYHESHELLKEKLNVALKYELRPMFCCGEPKEIRLAEKQESYVLKQLEESLFHLNADDFQRVIIAYEPVWAIGTGLTATPEEAQNMHHFIRTKIAFQYGDAVAMNTRILYGGSVNAGNAATLFAQPDVDGGLVGGASLKAEEFEVICKAV